MDGPLVTDRLTMRPFAADDLEAAHAIWSDPAVGPWIGGRHERLRTSIDELEGHLDHQARHGFSMWAALDRATGELVGEVGLQLLEGTGPEVEIGWCFARSAWGRGLATEAAEAWLRTGFEFLGLDRVVAVVLPDNARSLRVCEKLGMDEDGRRHVYGAEHVLLAVER